MKRQTGTFTALGNDHQIYTIYEYTYFEDTRSYDASLTAEIPGLKDFLTSDWEPVDCKENGIYEILTTGVILRRVEPRASNQPFSSPMPPL
jgi:hypothetical protein